MSTCGTEVSGAQLEGKRGKAFRGEAFPALKTLVRICAILENSMFLLDCTFKNAYLFRELNEKNSHIIVKYLKILELLKLV